MVKTLNLTKDKLCYRYFDNNLQKIVQIKNFQNGTGQILLIIVLTHFSLVSHFYTP